MKRDTLTIYDNNGQGRDVGAFDYNSFLGTNDQFLDLNTYEYLCVVYSERSSRPLRERILLCGASMQCVGLHVAQYNYGFRPMKNHNDDVIKSLLKLDSDYEINHTGLVMEQITRTMNCVI